MDIMELANQRITEFRGIGGKPTHIFVASVDWPFGYPEYVDGVLVCVDPYVPCGHVSVWNLGEPYNDREKRAK